MDKPSHPGYEIIQCVQLPLLNGEMPGPLHTIACDPAGNLYASVEIDHAVFSLDPGGCLRWLSVTEPGSAPTFYYPKGVAIGWIERAGSRQDCVAIADSWNHRLQFLDLQGKPLAAWTEAGGTPFVEPADVRFIPGTLGTTSEGGIWLVLDYGNHRLCALGPDGALRFATGRGFPTTLEANWSIPGAFFADGDRAVQYLERCCPALDFLWYPERILGDSADALLVYEPFRRRLKQLHFPHILPISFSPALDLQWVAADASALLGQDQDAGQLVRYDCAANTCERTHIAGRHVYSADPPSEFWIQKSGQVQRCRWIASAPAVLQSNASDLLLRSARNERAHLDPAAVRDAVESCLAAVREELEFAETIIPPDSAMPANGSFADFPARIQAFQHKTAAAHSRLNQVFHDWSVGELEQLVLGCPQVEFGNRLEISRLKQWVADQVSGMVARIDRNTERCGLAGEKTSAWARAAQAAADDLMIVRSWMVQWSGGATWPQ